MADDSSPPARGRLLVCATPIGNLGDVSPRLRETLAGTSVIACEDTRRTRELLSALGIPAPKLIAHHEHNERASADGIVQLLARGDDVVLVSDAGTPAVSDPGALVARAALEAGHDVVAVPGPSAVAAAISVAGCVGGQYRFVAFLPRTAHDLSRLLDETAQDVVVAFESPTRLGESLAAIAEVQPSRRVVLAREMTKRHEQTLAGDARSLAQGIAGSTTRGECVLVLDAMPPEAVATLDRRTVDLVLALVDEGVRMKTASKVVASHEGVPQRELYAAALERRGSE